jgi:hypothetical protein
LASDRFDCARIEPVGFGLDVHVTPLPVEVAHGSVEPLDLVNVAPLSEARSCSLILLPFSHEKAAHDGAAAYRSPCPACRPRWRYLACRLNLLRPPRRYRHGALRC